MPLIPGNLDLSNTANALLGSVITLTTTPIELKSGVNILEGRTKLFVINDSSNLVYLSDVSNFTPGVNHKIIAFSGESISFDLNPYPINGVYMRIYAAISEGSNTIRILEGK